MIYELSICICYLTIFAHSMVQKIICFITYFLLFIYLRLLDLVWSRLKACIANKVQMLGFRMRARVHTHTHIYNYTPFMGVDAYFFMRLRLSPTALAAS